MIAATISRARDEARGRHRRQQAADRVGVDAVDRLEQLLGGLGRQRAEPFSSPAAARILAPDCGCSPDVRAREPGVEQAAVGGVARETDGVGGRRHAGPAPFLKGMPVWKQRRARALAFLRPQIRQRHDADALGLAGARRAVDLDEMPVRIAQEELHGAVGQAVGLATVGRALEGAEASARRQASAKSSTATAKWCSGGTAVSRSKRCSWRSPRLSHTVGKPTSGTGSRSQPKSCS